MKKGIVLFAAVLFVFALATPALASDVNYGVFYKGNTGMAVMSTAWVKSAEGDWDWPKARGKVTMWKNSESVHNEKYTVVYFDYKFGQYTDPNYHEVWCWDFGGEYYFPEQALNDGKNINSGDMKPNSTGYPNFFMKPRPLPAGLEALLPPRQ